MEEIIKLGTPLDFKKRSMLFSCYRSLKKPFENSITFCEYSSENKKLQNELELKARAWTNILCDKVIQLLSSDKIIRDDNFEAIADYKCFKAEQHEYKALIAFYMDDRESEIEQALKLYKEASEIAAKNLNSAHPVAVNIVTKFFEFQSVLDFSPEARSIAIDAYEIGLSNLHKLPEEEHLKDQAKDRLELLKESINLFKHNSSVILE